MNFRFNNRYRLFLTAVTVFLCLVIVGCDQLEITTFYENGAIATAAPLATEIGESIFKQGGNAFDVAVAVGFALAVVHPEAGNIGGGGFALIRSGSSGTIEALDFREMAPHQATSDMYLDQDGNVIERLSTNGAKAAGVPGTVAGLYELWKRYGSLEWDQLLTPALLLADVGFVVDEYLHNSLERYRSRLSQFEPSADLFFPDGQTPVVGDIMKLPDLARTLSLIANEGPDGFYQGETAQLIVQSMTSFGGLIDSADLHNYKTVWREPVHFTFDSVDIYSMPPPSSGGILVGQILLLMEEFDFTNYAPLEPDYIHLFTEACRLAYADRSKHFGDPDYYNVPLGLLDPSYLARRRELIDLGQAGNSEQTIPGGVPINESTETTHYSVADGDGNMVSITYTINSSFGSKLVVDGAGFLLNNEMDDFSIKPGFPNIYGLIGGTANKIEPGKRMLSSMSPTLILKDGEPYMVIGAKGGSEIISSVAATILNVLRFDLGVNKTLALPRFHHQWLPNDLFLESGRFDINITQDLIGLGQNISERDLYSEIHMILINDNMMTIGCDPRGRGIPGGF